MTGYLSALDALLTGGLSDVGVPFLHKQGRFVEGQQLSDGGFRGRHGYSDLYYTDFAIRVLNLCNPESPALPKAADYLANLSPPLNVLDCFSRLNCNRLLQGRDVAIAPNSAAYSQTLRSLQLRGGWFPQPGTQNISAYHTFLAALCYDMLETPIPLPEAIDLLHREDGGYSNQPGESEGGTNPSAAVIGLLTLCDGLQTTNIATVTHFLANMQVSDGGFLSHRLAPESDLLSTFTALLTLFGMGGLESVRVGNTARFLKATGSHPGGGFSGTLADDTPDIEYTYYGIGTLALLATLAG